MARKGRRTPATKQDGLGGLFRRRSRHQKGQVLETWWLRYSVNGRQVRESSGTTVRTDALDMLRVKLAKVAKHEINVDRERLTVRDLMETLVARYEQKGRASLKTGMRATAKLWTAELGDVRAVHVTNKMLERIIATWKVSGATVNRRLAALRHAYRLSKIMMDPARLDVRDLWMRESDPRQVYMPPGTFAAILA